MENNAILPYPIRFQPHFRDYLWGGRNLEDTLGKPIPAQGVWAESWEIIDHPEHQSTVANGPFEGDTLRDLTKAQPEWVFGPHAKADDGLRQLPLLLKYLDCQRVLSVQVHPNDAYAQTMATPDLGKTEAWYIVAAEPGAKLYAGLRPGVNESELRSAVASGELEDCLHVIEPNAGDCVFIPAGTVHALGAGLLVAEIQQASNTTFRLFDWNRVGTDGKPRPLHVEQAMEVIDFQAGPRPVQTPESTNQAGRERLVSCDKFVLDRILPDAQLALAGDGRMHLLTAPYGDVQLQWESKTGAESTRLEKGQSVLLPATMPTTQAHVGPQGILLDMYLP